jgi:hypothetical protein
MSFLIDENAVQQVLAHNNGAPAYTVTASNLDISSEVSLSPTPSYTISSTVPQANSPSATEHEDLGFGTHVREAVEIVKDWIK